MRDIAGRYLKPGDPVTVRGPSDRPIYHNNSHGTVMRFGPKRVRVRIVRGAFESHDGQEETFLPEDLEYGYHGSARNADRRAEIMLDYKRAILSEAAQLAVNAGIINEVQFRRLVEFWNE